MARSLRRRAGIGHRAMFLNDLVNSGAIPALELTLRYAAQRHRLIAHNIANLDTPGHRPVDVPPAEFQRLLRQALDRRRAQPPGAGLTWPASRQIRIMPDGAVHLTPRTPGPGVLAHDRNNTDLEHLMRDHAENAGAYRLASELLRHRFQQLRDAIAERA